MKKKVCQNRDLERGGGEQEVFLLAFVRREIDVLCSGALLDVQCSGTVVW